MTWWNPEVLHAHIAPGFNEFSEAVIPDHREQFPEAQHWLTDYFLNSVLRAQFTEPQRQLVTAYLRRTHQAFIAYHDARDRSARYLENRGDGLAIGTYYSAVSAWESYVLAHSMATQVFCRFTGTKLFEKGDGSAECRLYDMANNVKHAGRGLDENRDEYDAIPLWLSNAGLVSYDGLEVSYADAAEVLADMSSLADKLRDPASLLEEAKARQDRKTRGIPSGTS